MIDKNYNPVKYRAQQAMWPVELFLWLVRSIAKLFKRKT